MHVDDMLSNVIVLVVILVIEDQEENVETGHDRCRDVYVVS